MEQSPLTTGAKVQAKLYYVFRIFLWAVVKCKGLWRCARVSVCVCVCMHVALKSNRMVSFSVGRRSHSVGEDLRNNERRCEAAYPGTCSLFTALDACVHGRPSISGVEIWRQCGRGEKLLIIEDDRRWRGSFDPSGGGLWR